MSKKSESISAARGGRAEPDAATQEASDEKSRIMHRVLSAESALRKAQKAVSEAEVELAVARRLAAGLSLNREGKRPGHGG